MTGAASHAMPGKKRRRWVLVLLTVLAVLAVVIAGAAAALVIFGNHVGKTFDNNTQEIPSAFPDETARPEPSVDSTQTILLLGSDTRGAIDTSNVDDSAGSRSDTIMVVRIPADRKQIFVMSIMRDTWVSIDGVGDAKINAAMAYGGVPLTVQTIEGLLNTRIDHVAMIDFEGFKGLTDALGGVTLTNPNDFSAGGFDFPAGPLDLNGEQALAFVRERHSFSSGDYQRVANQQLYIKAVLRKMLSRGTLTSPSTIQNSVAAISPYIAVDSGLDSKYLLSLIPSMRNIRMSDITFFTMPTAGTGTSEDGQSIVLLDQTRMPDLVAAFHDDTLANYVATHDLNPAPQS